MIPARGALTQAEVLLTERLKKLVPRLDAGDETAWVSYCSAATALAAITRETEPGAGGRLMTTKELAETLDVTPKTIFRRAKKDGALQPVRRVGRGRRAVLWTAEAGR
jgi:hypothetical protein